MVWELGSDYGAIAMTPCAAGSSTFVTNQGNADFTTKLTSYSGFGQLTANFTDAFRGILGGVAVRSHDHHHRLAHEPGLIGGRRVVGRRRLHGQGERPQRGQHLLRSDHGGHARVAPGSLEVNSPDPRVSMRTAHHGRHERARQRVHVVEEAPLPGEQGGVLDPGRSDLVRRTHRGGTSAVSASDEKSPAVRVRRRIFPTADFGIWSTTTMRLGRFMDGRPEVSRA